MIGAVLGIGAIAALLYWARKDPPRAQDVPILQPTPPVLSPVPNLPEPATGDEVVVDISRLASPLAYRPGVVAQLPWGYGKVFAESGSNVSVEFSHVFTERPIIGQPLPEMLAVTPQIAIVQRDTILQRRRAPETTFVELVSRRHQRERLRGGGGGVPR